MKYLLKFLGGSHSYGLNTPQSDEDLRGVFMHTDPSFIVGLNRFEHQENIAGGADEKFKELRHFLCLLRKANSEAIECLFITPKSVIEFSPEMELIWKNRAKLLDSEQLFKCLKGYMQGELKLANGERTGKLGSKRKTQIDKYKFSPKNFTQYFRLAWAGGIFFDKGYFPVNVFEEDAAFGNKLMQIKTKPETVTVEELNLAAKEAERVLEEKFKNRKTNFSFCQKTANELCLRLYYPTIKGANEAMKDNL